jgi:hypothetical protein
MRRIILASNVPDDPTMMHIPEGSLDLETLFRNRFEFEFSLLDMMLQCELNEYHVLGPLLLFHIDIFLEEFFKQILLFSAAILDAHANWEDSTAELVLFVLYCGPDRIDSSKQILMKIVTLFLDANPNSDAAKMIADAPDFNFVPLLFPFATEQVIDVAFRILEGCTHVIVVDRIVRRLQPWFVHLRLLPRHNFIMQGITPKFR